MIWAAAAWVALRELTTPLGWESSRMAVEWLRSRFRALRGRRGVAREAEEYLKALEDIFGPPDDEMKRGSHDC